MQVASLVCARDTLRSLLLFTVLLSTVAAPSNAACGGSFRELGGRSLLAVNAGRLRAGHRAAAAGEETVSLSSMMAARARLQAATVKVARAVMTRPDILDEIELPFAVQVQRELDAQAAQEPGSVVTELLRMLGPVVAVIGTPLIMPVDQKESISGLMSEESAFVPGSDAVEGISEADAMREIGNELLHVSDAMFGFADASWLSPAPTAGARTPQVKDRPSSRHSTTKGGDTMAARKTARRSPAHRLARRRRVSNNYSDTGTPGPPAELAPHEWTEKELGESLDVSTAVRQMATEMHRIHQEFGAGALRDAARALVPIHEESTGEEVNKAQFSETFSVSHSSQTMTDSNRAVHVTQDCANGLCETTETVESSRQPQGDTGTSNAPPQLSGPL